MIKQVITIFSLCYRKIFIFTVIHYDIALLIYSENVFSKVHKLISYGGKIKMVALLKYTLLRKNKHALQNTSF